MLRHPHPRPQHPPQLLLAPPQNINPPIHTRQPHLLRLERRHPARLCQQPIIPRQKRQTRIHATLEHKLGRPYTHRQAQGLCQHPSGGRRRRRRRPLSSSSSGLLPRLGSLHFGLREELVDLPRYAARQGHGAREGEDDERGAFAADDEDDGE
ncbi:hypothetical protein VTJ49DRAFT_5709 [Mycothermus thermophilus]|uniref:Uncharacterized protein n=1 Tax=Humicola insolens TaxID=85995 RepID=A0ABR3V3P4_HUMIN